MKNARGSLFASEKLALEYVLAPDGFDAIKNNERVLKAYTVKHVGDVIGNAGTTPQVVGNILYTFSQCEDRKSVAEELMNMLRIEDENGESISWYTLGKAIS